MVPYYTDDRLEEQNKSIPGAGVSDLDVSEASIPDQLDSRCAQALGEGHKGLQLGQDLCRYHGSVYCCCCQLTLQQEPIALQALVATSASEPHST